MKCLKLYILLLSLSFAGPIKAQVETEGTIQTEVVDYVNKSIEKTLIPISESQEASADWELKRIWIRMQNQIGIKIPWVASFRVVPEVEFIIER